MRSQTRIINVELLFYGFALALVSILLFKYFKKNHILIFLALVSLVVLDNYFKPANSYRMSKEISQTRVNILKEKMKDIPEGNIVSYEFHGVVDNEAAYYQIDGMLAAQSLNLKSINGYTATIPNGFYYAITPSRITREIWFKEKNFEPDTVYVITN
jgi:hypothetical protein